jgi:tight adherence protein C
MDSMLVAVLGAVAIAGGALLLVWTLAGGGDGSADATHNLTTGLALAPDLREAMLNRSARDRAFMPAIGGITGMVRRITPTARVDRLELRIIVAGSPPGWTVDSVLASKTALGFVGLVLGVVWFVLSPSLLIAIGGLLLVFVGYVLPDALLSRRAGDRQDEIRRALPDLLDQLTITVEAGLAFEAALVRSCRTGSGPLNEEMIRTMQDIQVGMGRREALRQLADRVDVPELRSFVAAVSQAEEYGVPIAQVLRVQAGELRLRRSQRAEEQAMKLPVKLLFPTVFFIFPVLFIVLLGPAALQIAQGL